MKIKELCERERPREKLLAEGAGKMSDAELLAILIGSGTRNENVLEVANRLLSLGEGKLSVIAAMDQAGMKTLSGIGDNRYAAIAAAFELGKRCCLEDPGIEKVPVKGPGSVFRMMLPHMKGLDHEEFWVIFLNRANYVICKEMISLGGIGATVAEPRQIVKRALDKHATGLILVHNHPSGNPEPGEADKARTSAMKKAANTFDIALLDHVIITDGCYFSFAEGMAVTVSQDTEGA